MTAKAEAEAAAEVALLLLFPPFLREARRGKASEATKALLRSRPVITIKNLILFFHRFASLNLMDDSKAK